MTRGNDFTEGLSAVQEHKRQEDTTNNYDDHSPEQQTALLRLYGQLLSIPREGGRQAQHTSMVLHTTKMFSANNIPQSRHGAERATITTAPLQTAKEIIETTTTHLLLLLLSLLQLHLLTYV
jgi:hypothetical protein